MRAQGGVPVQWPFGNCRYQTEHRAFRRRREGKQSAEAVRKIEYPSGVGRSAPCLLNVPVLGLHGVEDTVGSERFDRFDEIEAAMEAEPLSGVAMPLDVEAVGADPVEASEGRVELLAEIFREAGAVALDEAILGAMPFAEDIDGIVELRRPD